MHHKVLLEQNKKEERKRKKVWSFALFFRAQSPQRKDVHLSFSVHYFTSEVRLDLFVKDSWLSKIRVSLISRMGIYSDAMNLSMSAPSFWFLVFSFFSFFFFVHGATLFAIEERERGREDKVVWSKGWKETETDTQTHTHTHTEGDGRMAVREWEGWKERKGRGWMLLSSSSSYLSIQLDRCA